MSTVFFMTKIIDLSGRPILTTLCCREYRFFFFCWLKSYNCASLPWKSILYSDSFHGTQLPYVLWIFCLKLLTSQLGQFSRHLAAVSAVFFFCCWLNSCNSASVLWKGILFSANFHKTQLPLVPWIFCLKLLTSQVSQFSLHLASMSALVFFFSD